MSGLLFTIEGPSGVGKTTLSKRLERELGGVRECVSHTTRCARTGEVDGVNYHYVDHNRFIRMLREGEFIEHVERGGVLYGLARAEVQHRMATGHGLAVVDHHGAGQLVTTFKPNVRRIFLDPPDREDLAFRMKLRGDRDRDVELRLNRAVFDADMQGKAVADLVIPPGSVDLVFHAARIFIEKSVAGCIVTRPSQLPSQHPSHIEWSLGITLGAASRAMDPLPDGPEARLAREHLAEAMACARRALGIPVEGDRPVPPT